MARKYLIRNPKKKKKKRRNVILGIITFICFCYYYYNYSVKNSLHEFISENLLIQSIFLFGTLYTFLSPFFNLTFTKQLSDEDIIKAIEQKKNEDEQLEQIIKDATIG